MCAIAGLMASSAFGQAKPTGQTPANSSDDKTPPGTGALDLPRGGPIVGGRDLQPRPSGPPSKQETQQINQLLQQAPPDPAANGPIVQPHDLFGNPLGGSPILDQKKP
jgi:hypothetical protein